MTSKNDSSESLAVQRVNVRRAPGFAVDGFQAEGFSEDITVVHGPNASGKSTLAHSIRALLWPDQASPKAELTGEFSLADDEWRVNVTGEHGTYQRNGADASRPSLPAATESDQYHLALHDLLQHDTRNQSFAEEIRQQSRGGYDLPTAHRTLGYDDSPNTAQISEHTAANDARREYREAEQSAKALKQEEAQLTSLQQDLEDAKAAKSRLELLDSAIEHAEIREDLAAAEETLDTDYPDILADLDGTEAERVAKLDERIADHQDEIDAAEKKQQQAEQELASADLPSDGVSESVLERLRKHREELASLEDKRATKREELKAARKKRTQVATEIPLEIEDEALAGLEPEAWADIETFLKDVTEYQQAKATHESVQEWLTDDEEIEADVTELRDAKRTLEQWLASPPPDQSAEDARSSVTPNLISAAVTTLSGITLGTLVNPALYAVVLLALVPLWYAYKDRNEEPETNASARATFREEFATLSVAPPNEWTEDAVRDRVRSLSDQIATAALASEREQQRTALSNDAADLDATEARIEEERNTLIETYGATPSTSDAELAAITKGVLRWQQYNQDVQGREAKLRELESQIEDVRSTLANDLTDYGYEAVPDAATAAGHIQELAARQQDHKVATEKLDEATTTLDTKSQKRDDLRAERKQIFTDVGLEPDATERLQELCDQLEEYEEVSNQVQRLTDQLTERASELEQHPGYDPELKDRSVQELKDEQTEIQEQADQYEQLLQDIQDIQTKLSEAKQGNDVEAAAAERRRAMDALEAELQADVEATVGDVLVERLQEQTDVTSRPAVFDTANDLLLRITSGRYRLELDDDEFYAHDTVKDRAFRMDELSSGTRVQVLLAVRIAFVDEQESGAKLPLVFDETLANTDDIRAEVIIESLIELAREGRQIFYFTAQGDTVARFKHAVADASSVSCSVIDLGEETEADETLTIPDPNALGSPTETLPDPATHDHTEYGEALGVPEFSPRHGAGAAHLWYLIEDPDLLHQFLSVGIEYWGQLKSLLERTEDSLMGADQNQLNTIESNGAALETYVTEWLTGRGNPVDRQALEDTAAVTNNFIDRVSDLANELDGDAEALVNALDDGEVKRFHSDKVEELREYFQANGYISNRDPLSDPEITARIVSRLKERGLDTDTARDRTLTLINRIHPTNTPPIQ